jgi:hypothetical protein
MMARILPVEEWERLSVTGLVPIFPDFPPEDVVVVVVEQDGEIVASTTLVRVVHLESLWIKEEAGAGVSRALIRGIVDASKEWAPRVVMAQTRHQNVSEILTKLGGAFLPVESYVLRIDGRH